MSDFIQLVLEAILGIAIWELLKSFTGTNRYRWECKARGCDTAVSSNSKELVEYYKEQHIVSVHKEKNRNEA